MTHDRHNVRREFGLAAARIARMAREAGVDIGPTQHIMVGGFRFPGDDGRGPRAVTVRQASTAPVDNLAFVDDDGEP